MGEKRPQIDIKHYQVNPSIPGMCCILSNRTEGPYSQLETLQAIACANDYSPQPDSKVLSLRTSLTYFTEHKEIEICYVTRNFSTC